MHDNIYTQKKYTFFLQKKNVRIYVLSSYKEMCARIFFLQRKYIFTKSTRKDIFFFKILKYY